MNEKEKILIVDDDEGTCKTLSLIFRKKGYEVEMAGTGKKTMEIIRKKSFNLALLDIKLPDIEGVDLMEKIKKKQPEIKVIMITGWASVDNAIHSLNAGANAYIVKPLDMDRVLVKVNDILEKQRLVRENLKANKKIRYLLSVLRASFNVSQHILRDKDPDRLIHNICDVLIETRGHKCAWIILNDEKGNLVTSASAGMGENFLNIIGIFNKGELPLCCQKTLEQPGIVITENSFNDCGSCQAVKEWKGFGYYTIRLEYRKNVFGFMSVSVPDEYIGDKEGQRLIKEVSNELAYALYNIEIEKSFLHTSEKQQNNEQISAQGRIKKDIPDKNLLTNMYNWHNKTILIVEDDEDDYRFLSDAFEKTRVQLLWTKAGKEAVNICRSDKNINLVMLDIRLPDISGYDVARQIKELREKLPVITQTAYITSGEREKCLEAGCDDYFVKPLYPEKILELISKYLGKS